MVVKAPAKRLIMATKYINIALCILKLDPKKRIWIYIMTSRIFVCKRLTEYHFWSILMTHLRIVQEKKPPKLHNSRTVILVKKSKFSSPWICLWMLYSRKCSKLIRYHKCKSSRKNKTSLNRSKMGTWPSNVENSLK